MLNVMNIAMCASLRKLANMVLLMKYMKSGRASSPTVKHLLCSRTPKTSSWTEFANQRFNSFIALCGCSIVHRSIVASSSSRRMFLILFEMQRKVLQTSSLSNCFQPFGRADSPDLFPRYL